VYEIPHPRIAMSRTPDAACLVDYAPPLSTRCTLFVSS